MGDQLALWSLLVNAVGLAGIAATLVLMVKEWRSSRSIFWTADTFMSVDAPGRKPRYRRIVKLVWSAATTVGEVRLTGANIIAEMDPSIRNGGNSPGIIAANQAHLILAESDDWPNAWVSVIYLRPRSRVWVVAWQALAGRESTLPLPKFPNRLKMAVYRLTWRWRPVPRVGPNDAGAAFVSNGSQFEAQLHSAVGDP